MWPSLVIENFTSNNVGEEMLVGSLLANGIGGKKMVAI